MEKTRQQKIFDFVIDGAMKLRAEHLSDLKDIRLLIHPKVLDWIIQDLNAQMIGVQFLSTSQDLTMHNVRVDTNFPLMKEVWLIDRRLVDYGRDELILKFKIE